MGNGDDILRAYAIITALQSNVPNDYEVEGRWVQEFNDALDKLETLVGRDHGIFKVPADALVRSVASLSTITGTAMYRDGLWCRREVLMHKVEAR